MKSTALVLSIVLLFCLPVVSCGGSQPPPLSSGKISEKLRPDAGAQGLDGTFDLYSDKIVLRFHDVNNCWGSSNVAETRNMSGGTLEIQINSSTKKVKVMANKSNSGRVYKGNLFIPLH